MKLPKDYFTNLTADKYREYLKLLPSMQQENTRIVTTLIFTFFALAFFGLFAINPTITTIIELRKKLADNQLVYDRLDTKIQNLSSLQSQYNQLSTDIPFVLEAVPQNPQTTQLLSQVLGLARQKNITITSLETSSVTLFENETQTDPSLPEDESINPVEETGAETKNEESKNSFTFTVNAQGSYDALLDFTRSLSGIQRIVMIESISINSDSGGDNLSINIEARAYFKK